MHDVTGCCHASVVTDGHLVSARVPVGSHHTVDALCLCHCMVVSSMAADSERAGLDHWTVGMMPMVIKVQSPFVHPIRLGSFFCQQV